MQNLLLLQTMGVNVMDYLRRLRASKPRSLPQEASKIIFRSRVCSVERDKMCSRLLEVYNSMLLSDTMSESMRKGIIILIYQQKAQGGNQKLVANIIAECRLQNPKFITNQVRTDYLKVLGTWHRGARACTKSRECITKVKRKLLLWEHRTLSLVGINLVIRVRDSVQTVKFIWQNALSPELPNKHQDIAWLV
eukprot:g31559.t1